jgi:hypothetical protein
MQTQTNHQLMPVQFQGATLFLTEEKKDPYVPMKPIVEGIGLDWKSQHRKLTAQDERWNSVIVSMTTTGSDGKSYKMICMPLRKLNGWLMSISPTKVHSDIRERVIAYQNECDDVLWEHWSGVKNGEPKGKLNILSDLNKELVAATNIAKGLGFNPSFARAKAIQAVKDQHGIDAAAMFGLNLEDMCPKERMDIEIERLNMPTNDVLLSPFWELVNQLELEEKHSVNWSKDPHKIAINLAKFKQLCIDRGITTPEALNNKNLLKESVTPKFIAANINHRHALDGSQSRCWIFEK